MCLQILGFKITMSTHYNLVVDHEIWFILIHPDDLFLDKTIEFHSSLLCSWLGRQARNPVLAQISLTNFWNTMLEALKELKGDDPWATLTTYMNFKWIKIINILLNPSIKNDSTTPPMKRPSLPPASPNSLLLFSTHLLLALAMVWKSLKTY